MCCIALEATSSRQAFALPVRRGKGEGARSEGRQDRGSARGARVRGSMAAEMQLETVGGQSVEANERCTIPADRKRDSTSGR